MIFQELVLQNFGPYRGRQIIDLSPQRDRPIILIGGLNGGGKTTLMDALRLALYGPRAPIERRRQMSYGDFLSQCVSSATPTDEETRVELTFQNVIHLSGLDKQATIRVIRRWQRQPKGGKDQLTVELDHWHNELLTQTWNEQIEAWLPLGLSNLFLFDGEQIKDLADQPSPPPSMVDAIRAVLGLTLADRLAADLTILVNRKQASHAATADQQNFDRLEHDLAQLNHDLQQAQAQQDVLQQALQTAQAQLKQAEDQFFTQGGHLTEQENLLQAQLNTAQTEYQVQAQALRDLAASTLPLALVQPLLKNAAQQGQYEQAQQQAAIAQTLLTQHDQRLLDLLSQLKLKPKQTQQIETFIAQEAQQLEQTAQTQPWLQATDTALNQLNQILQHQLPHEQQLAQTHKKKLQNLAIEIAAVETKLAKAATPEDYEKLWTQRDLAEQALSECQFKLDLHKRHQQSLEKRQQQIQGKLANLSAEAIADNQTQTLIQSAQKVQTTLTAFKARLTEQKLTQLERQITQYFRCLLHKQSLVHRVLVDSQTFQLTLYDPAGQPLSTHQLSAGEKQLLAVAFLWGLATTSGHQIPVAIDTPLGRLDSEHRHNLVDRYFPQASHQVILLSTDTEIRAQEVSQLRSQAAISREYLLEYDPNQRQTAIVPGYFW